MLGGACQDFYSIECLNLGTVWQLWVTWEIDTYIGLIQTPIEVKMLAECIITTDLLFQARIECTN